MSNPTLPTGAGDRRIVEGTTRCRVTQAGWYGPSKNPVAVDDIVVLSRSDAFLARSLGRVVFAS